MARRRRPRDTDETTSEDEPTPQMTLSELAEKTGLTPRTIRYYQTKRLLQAPAKDPTDGRVARYGEHHVERLRLIGELHDRGLKLPAIKELVESGNASSRVADWLGLDASLGGSWSAEEPELMDRLRLDEILEGTPPGTRATFEEAGLVRRQGSSWLAHSPALLSLSAGLVRDGIDIQLVLEAGAILESHLASAAADLMKLFESALKEGFGEGRDPGELLKPLRPIAGDAARLLFAQQLEAAIRRALADPRRLTRS